MQWEKSLIVETEKFTPQKTLTNLIDDLLFYVYSLFFPHIYVSIGKGKTDHHGESMIHSSV